MFMLHVTTDNYRIVSELLWIQFNESIYFVLNIKISLVLCVQNVFRAAKKCFSYSETV